MRSHDFAYSVAEHNQFYVYYIDMPDVPPPKYAAYPRGNNPSTYGTTDQLEALGQAYFGYSWLFLGAIATSLAGFGIAFATNIFPYFIQMPLVFLVVTFGSHGLNKKVAYGKNWSSGAPLAASLLMGLSAILCCGIIGFVIIQTIALNEIKRYGIKTGTFTFTRKKFNAAVQERRNADIQEPGPVPPGGAA